MTCGPINPNLPPIIFGHYFQPFPTPYNFYGTSGFWAVPGGYNWKTITDAFGQRWVSPNALTLNADGTVSGSPLYAADLHADGTLVYIDCLANRKIGIDSPPRQRLL